MQWSETTQEQGKVAIYVRRSPVWLCVTLVGRIDFLCITLIRVRMLKLHFKCAFSMKAIDLPFLLHSHYMLRAHLTFQVVSFEMMTDFFFTFSAVVCAFDDFILSFVFRYAFCFFSYVSWCMCAEANVLFNWCCILVGLNRL